MLSGEVHMLLDPTMEQDEDEAAADENEQNAASNKGLRAAVL